MTTIQSQSSQIESFSYDAESETLHIKFRTGGTWKYSDVPADKFAEMQAAASHGKFFHARVKPYHHAEKIGVELAFPLAKQNEIE